VRNPNKATTRVSINRPDTYERLPRTCQKSFANSSRYIHMGRKPHSPVRAESVNSLQARDEIRTAARADIQTGAVRGLSLRCGGRFETCLLDAGFRINDCKPAKSTLADSPITLGNHPYFNRYRRATHRTKTIKRHSNRCLCGSHLRSELNRANLDRGWTSAPQCGALTHSTGFRATSPRR